MRKRKRKIKVVLVACSKNTFASFILQTFPHNNNNNANNERREIFHVDMSPVWLKPNTHISSRGDFWRIHRKCLKSKYGTRVAYDKDKKSEILQYTRSLWIIAQERYHILAQLARMYGRKQTMQAAGKQLQLWWIESARVTLMQPLYLFITRAGVG